jgi:hypothetical protein
MRLTMCDPTSATKSAPLGVIAASIGTLKLAKVPCPSTLAKTPFPAHVQTALPEAVMRRIL